MYYKSNEVCYNLDKCAVNTIYPHRLLLHTLCWCPSPLPLPFFYSTYSLWINPSLSTWQKTQTCPIVLFGIGVQPPQLYRHLFFPSGRVLLHAFWMKRSEILFKGVFPKSHTHYWLCVQLTLQLPTSQLQVSPDNGASKHGGMSLYLMRCLYDFIWYR